MEDILVQIAPSGEDNNQMIVTNAISGKSQTTVSTKVVVVNGRIAKKTPGIVGKSSSGVFYNPVLIARNGNINELRSTAAGTFYKDDGSVKVSLDAHDGMIDKRNIVLPTMISNANDEQPQFYSLVAAGDNAIKLASAPIGSSVHVVGEMRDCWVGKFSVKVLWVFDMTLRKKGAYNDLC